MNYTMRPLTENDVAETRALMRSCKVIDTDFHLEHYPPAPRFPTLIAEVNQTIVGVAAKYYNSTHPLYPALMVVVHPDYRRQGIGRALHYQTLKSKPLEYTILGWQTAWYQHETDVIGFIQAMGYQHCLDCNIIEVDLTQFSHHPELTREFRHLRIVPFIDLFTTPKSKQQLFDFLVGRYIENHQWSPPVYKEHPNWANILDEINPEISFALMDDKHIVAASSTLRENKASLDVGWSYATPEHGQKNAQAFLRHLLAHQFRAAIKAGFTQANMEVDSTDKDKLGLLEWLPLQTHEVWKIFQT
jgi:GNAT superfamily N-acetyltransferase